MKFTLALISIAASYVAAQAPPGGAPKAPGGGAPSPGKGPATLPGSSPGGGAGGSGFKMPCGLKCLMTPMKSSSCPSPFGNKGATGRSASPPSLFFMAMPPPDSPPPTPAGKGSPTDSSPRPRPTIDQAAMTAYRDCICKDAGMKTAIDTCVPQDCSSSGGDGSMIQNMFSKLCNPSSGGAPGSKGGAGGAGKAPGGGSKGGAGGAGGMAGMAGMGGAGKGGAGKGGGMAGMGGHSRA